MQGITLGGHVANVPQIDDAGNCEIVRWIAENGVPEKNIHDYGMVSNHLMPEVFAQADVAVFPNRCEGDELGGNGGNGQRCAVHLVSQYRPSRLD